MLNTYTDVRLNRKTVHTVLFDLPNDKLHITKKKIKAVDSLISQIFWIVNPVFFISMGYIFLNKISKEILFLPVFCPTKIWQTARPEILKTGNTTYHCPAVFNMQSFWWFIYYTAHKTRKACFSETDFDRSLRSHFNRLIFDCWYKSFLFCLLSLLLFLTAFAFPI